MTKRKSENQPEKKYIAYREGTNFRRLLLGHNKSQEIVKQPFKVLNGLKTGNLEFYTQ